MHLLPPGPRETVLSWLEGLRRALPARAWRASAPPEAEPRYPAGRAWCVPVPPRLRGRPYTGARERRNLTDLPAFIAGLPKAELHVHHVGSASPGIVAELAARHEGRSPVPADPEALADYFAFRDFAHFIEVYLSVVDLIRDPEDVRMLTYEVARELARQQVRYAELTVTPYSHVHRGHPRAGVLRGDRGRPQTAPPPTSASTCAGASTSPARPACRPPRRRCGSRSRSAPTGWSASASAGPRSGCRGRSSSRTSTGRAPPGCAACRTPARPPARRPIWDALRDLGAERIGHGIAAAQDPRLLAHLAEHRIPLEVCPTSNVRDPGGRHLDEHPLRRWSRPGCLVTHQLRRPADVRHHAQRRVRGRRPPARRSDRTGLAALARDAVDRGLPRRGRQGRGSRAEIDAYLACWHAAEAAERGGARREQVLGDRDLPPRDGCTGRLVPGRVAGGTDGFGDDPDTHRPVRGPG